MGLDNGIWRGSVLMLGGCAALLVGSFLPWVAFHSFNRTFWTYFWSTSGAKVSASVLVLASVALSASWLGSSRAREERAWVSGAAAIAGLLTGAVVWGVDLSVSGTFRVSSWHVADGFWITLIGALTVAGGALMSLLAGASVGATRAAATTPPRRRPHQRRRPAGAVASATAGLTEPIGSTVSAGWYDDPAGERRERYWDGGAWTERVRD